MSQARAAQLARHQTGQHFEQLGLAVSFHAGQAYDRQPLPEQADGRQRHQRGPEPAARISDRHRNRNQHAGGGNAPGVVVVQEWWGLSENIKGLCDRFAVAGFDALAPDLYKGVVVPYHDTDAANAQMTSLDFMDATTQNVRGAAQYLARNGAKVGLTGFCLGGAVTIIGATKIAELTAGVVFYGIPPEQAAKPADVKIPLQAHFANKDDWCTPQVVNDFEKAMSAGGTKPEIFRYDAQHAFANEKSPAYDAPSAKQAWERTMTFLGKHL